MRRIPASSRKGRAISRAFFVLLGGFIWIPGVGET
jgi:hypothetical protein